MINEDDLRKALSEMINPLQIDEECLLVARFGEGTWGHWLGEILPRAAIAEEFFPGRFSYAVPGWTMKGGTKSTFLQSLAAYGISESRLIKLMSPNCYRFRSLSTITPVRSDRAMHPQVMELMRTNVAVPLDAADCDLPSKLALMRKDVGRRAISNFEDVEKVLKATGFYLTEASEHSFGRQVSLFRSARDVFCVLGSGLTNVIFSPEYVNVIAPAPEAWGDAFFYSLVQARNGKFADIRGPCTEIDQNPNQKRESKFSVPIDQLEAVLDLLKIS
jgi:capsular polysaccharide biosynthesis protein